MRDSSWEIAVVGKDKTYTVEAKYMEVRDGQIWLTGIGEDEDCIIMVFASKQWIWIRALE